ncbi:MAG: DrmE family protein [Bacillota bacterium]
MKTAADLIQMSKRRPCLVNGFPLIDNKFMQLNRNIMAKAFINNQRTGTTILLHPGTNQLFYQAIFYALIAGYLTYDFQIEEYANQFIEGDTVTLDGRTRCKFIGIDRDSKYFTVLKDDGTRISNPLSSIHRIKLYQGKAKTLGTRGIRKTVRASEKFLEEWIGTEYVFTIRTQPCSILVVCNKKDAQEIINSVISDKDKHFLFSELFPSTWFSGIDSYEDFFGNSIRTRPVVMFTSRISIARDIIFNDRDKRIRSVIINGIDIISSSKQELEDIMKRRSVHSTILLAGTAYGVLPDFQINDTPISLVYWSKDALLSLLDDLCNEPCTENPRDILLKKLIDNEIDHKTDFEQILPPFDPELPIICRKSLKKMCNFANEDSDIKRFAISAFGLLRLYEQACFSIAFYEELIKNGTVSARLPSNELIFLNEIFNSQIVESEIKDALTIVISTLKDMHFALYENNPKLEKILSLLSDSGTKKYTKKVIVVPKDSYALTINTYITSKLNQSINIYSVGRFNDEEVFDCIIVSGVFEGGKYDPFKNNNSPETIVLGYPSEESYFYRLKNEFQKVTADYEARSILSYEKDSEDYNFNCSTPEEMDFMMDLEKQIFEMMPDAWVTDNSGSGSQTAVTLKAVRLVIFENDEFGLFTEYYSPYVFDEETGKINEGDVEKLAEGDLLIFAVRDDITDFVDMIMEKLIPSTEPTFQEYYRMSRRWKTVLREYMIRNNMSCIDISRKLDELGHFKHPVTIRSWLNKDSRIIGPRDEDSFIAIALVTEDDEMSRLSNTYCRACDEVRSMRIRILHYIENQIIKSYAGAPGNLQDQFLASIIGDAKQYARGLRIASITPINREIPASFANRPHGL